MTPALLPLWDGKWDNGEEGPLQPGKRGQGRGAGQRWPQTATPCGASSHTASAGSWGEGRGRGSLVESKAGAVPSAPLSCMGNTSTNSFLKTDSR